MKPTIATMLICLGWHVLHLTPDASGQEERLVQMRRLGEELAQATTDAQSIDAFAKLLELNKTRLFIAKGNVVPLYAGSRLVFGTDKWTLEDRDGSVQTVAKEDIAVFYITDKGEWQQHNHDPNNLRAVCIFARGSVAILEVETGRIGRIGSPISASKGTNAR